MIRTDEYKPFQLGNRCASIGFWRDDGDFQLLATLNNNDEMMSDETFFVIVTSVRLMYQSFESIDIYYRQDAPDYLDEEGGSK